MRKCLVLLITTISAISIATESDPIDDYSIEELYMNSSVVVDGVIYHITGISSEEIGSEFVERINYKFKPDAVLINDTNTNIKRDTTIEFEYVSYGDLGGPTSRLPTNEKIRLFLPRYIRDLNEKIVITSKNQIHPELYETGKRSDETSESTVVTSSPDTVATPPWYWLVGGVASMLVYGGVTFRLGTVYERRRTKPVQRANGPANES